jgi:ComF family protein
MWYRAIDRLASWLLPLRCRVCSQPGGQGIDLCGACLEGAWPNPSACPLCALPLLAASGEHSCGRCARRPLPLDACHAGWLYGAPVDVLVRRYKFEQDLAAGAVLAGLMLRRRPDWLEGQVLVPVPLHPRRLRQRGFDQGRELVRLLARGTGLVRADVLQRVVDTGPQSQLDERRRRANLRGAFAATRAVPAQVVLVDDVMTTGATLAAAASALRKAGVRQVRAWVAARTP